MRMTRILLLEDDINIGDLVEYLSDEGFGVDFENEVKI
ncbi:hypothetical protein C414_000040052 [Campylobacter jejuni subsp. jejuni 414]|nr:hypothetical protein C414_000040052 [Campylobacter jejuni subsp. jejuni 414]